jgi:excisionase family DNA binding protein
MSRPAVPLALTIELSGEQIEAIAERVAGLLADAQPTPAEWLNANDAAKHLACTRDRLYDLVQLGKLEPRRDGRRLLFRRSDLDAYIEAAR